MLAGAAISVVGFFVVAFEVVPVPDGFVVDGWVASVWIGCALAVALGVVALAWPQRRSQGLGLLTAGVAMVPVWPFVGYPITYLMLCNSTGCG